MAATITFERDNGTIIPTQLTTVDSFGVGDDICSITLDTQISKLYENTRITVRITQGDNTKELTYIIDSITNTRTKSEITARKTILDSDILNLLLLDRQFLVRELNQVCNVDNDSLVRLIVSILSNEQIESRFTERVEVEVFADYLRGKLGDSSRLIEIAEILAEHGLAILVGEDNTVQLKSLTYISGNITLGESVIKAETSSDDYFGYPEGDTFSEQVDDLVNSYVSYYLVPNTQETYAFPVDHKLNATVIPDLQASLEASMLAVIKEVLKYFTQNQVVEIHTNLNLDIGVNNRITTPDDIFLNTEWQAIQVQHQIHTNTTIATCRPYVSRPQNVSLALQLTERATPAPPRNFRLDKASGGQMFFKFDSPVEGGEPSGYLVLVTQINPDGREVEHNPTVIPYGTCRSILMTQLQAETQYKVELAAINTVASSGAVTPTIEGTPYEYIPADLNIRLNLMRGGDNVPISINAYDMNTFIELAETNEALVNRNELQNILVEEENSLGRHGNFILNAFGADADIDENTYYLALLDPNSLEYNQIIVNQSQLFSGRLIDLYGIESTLNIGAIGGVVYGLAPGPLGSAAHAKYFLDIYQNFDKFKTLADLRKVSRLSSASIKAGLRKGSFTATSKANIVLANRVSFLRTPISYFKLGGVTSGVANKLLIAKLFQLTKFINFGRFLRLVPGVGTFAGAILSAVDIAAALEQFLDDEGVFLSIVQSGNGYEITDSILEYRFRRTSVGGQPIAGDVVASASGSDSGGWLLNSTIGNYVQSGGSNRGWLRFPGVLPEDREADLIRVSNGLVYLTAKYFALDDNLIEARKTPEQNFQVVVPYQASIQHLTENASRDRQLVDIQFRFRTQVQATSPSTFLPTPGNAPTPDDRYWSRSLVSDPISINRLITGELGPPDPS